MKAPPTTSLKKQIPSSISTRPFLAFSIGIVLAGALPILPAHADIVVITTDDQLDTPAGPEISLREAIRDAVAGESITFELALDGQTITLGQGGTGSGQLLIDKNLTIDASSLTAGLTIDANGTSRVMEISPGNTVTLTGLAFTGGVTVEPETAADEADGNGAGLFNNQSTVTLNRCLIYGNSAFGSGGGIDNGAERLSSLGASRLTLYDCIIRDNTAGRGGGGLKSGSFTGGDFDGGIAILNLHDCIVSGNSAAWGQGIFDYGRLGNTNVLSLDGCTLTGNLGVAIQSTSDRDGHVSVTLNKTTISGNTGEGVLVTGDRRGISTVSIRSSTIFANGGNGIYTDGRGGTMSVAIANTILSDLREVAGSTEATTTLLGRNIISNTSGNNGLVPVEALIVGPPELAAIGWYGGTTQTMPPLPGSQVIDSAVGSTATEDQRGFPIVSTADIGAAEYQGHDDLERFWALDWDGDGNTFGVEQALGTNPFVSDPAHAGNPALVLDEAGNPLVSFGWASSAAPGTIWSITRSPDLTAGSFVEIYRFDGSTGTLTDPNDEIDFNLEERSISVTDNGAPVGSAYYRFEAILWP